MRVPLVAGREFNESDNNPQPRRILIDRALAAKAFPDASAVGQRLLMRFRTIEPEWFEIIGVVAHQRLTGLADPGPEQSYLADGYWNYRVLPGWAVRTRAIRRNTPGRSAPRWPGSTAACC